MTDAVVITSLIAIAGHGQLRPGSGIASNATQV